MVDKEDKMAKANLKIKTKVRSEKGSEGLMLDINLSDDLKDLLNKCVVDSDDRVETRVRLGDGDRSGTGYTNLTFKRFKVFKFVYHNLYSGNDYVSVADNNGYDLLFNETLVKTGTVSYAIDTLKQVDAIISLLKTNITRSLEAYYKSQKYEMTISVNVADN